MIKNKKQKKKTKYSVPLQFHFHRLLMEIKELEDHLEKHPEECEQIMQRISNLLKNAFASLGFQSKILYGFFQYWKRAKRRATRKPLTIRKVRALAEELYTITKIFKV